MNPLFILCGYFFAHVIAFLFLKKSAFFVVIPIQKGNVEKTQNILCSNFIVTVVFIALDGDALYSYVEKSYFYAAIM